MSTACSRLTAGAAAKMRFEQDALNDATSKNIRLSRPQIDAIRNQADEYGRLTDKMASAKLVQNLQFERDQMFRSESEKGIASQLRSAGLPVDLTSQDAAILRADNLVKQYGSTWESVGEIGRSSIDKMTDGLQNGFKNGADIFKSILGDINREMLQLAVANPLKNAIFGDNQTTLADVGGVSGFFSALTGGKMPVNPSVGAGIHNTASMSVTRSTVIISGEEGQST
ncbi:hypothetical protein [Pararhizobium gei]|uniref:hypothetical protein n=1 Tax=Pararhizobium gei TaxID=1395951 RepID=UPI0023DA6265|nr:hypothetical protein [Rhizobium gei]